MTPDAWDHAFTAALLFAIPLWGRVEYHRLQRRHAGGSAATKADLYRNTILVQWALAALLLVAWFLQGRDAASLGLAVRADDGARTGAVVVLAGLGVLALQRAAVARLRPAGRARLRRQFARTWALLPADAREHRWFRVLAVTAGVCEELLYRGFLIPYCSAYAGPSGGALLAAAAFGLGHFYQGVSGVLKTFLVGAAAGWLYLETQSLLWPMILHSALDLQGGALGRRVRSAQSNASPPG
jgi:membrane protease YdiL (CAAX protease family)